MAADVLPLEDWVTVQQAKDLLKVSYQTVHNMITRGELEARVVGGDRRTMYLVSEKSIAQILKSKPQGSYTLS